MLLSKNTNQEFPGGGVDRNLPADTGNRGFTPGWEDSIAMEQLSPCATTTEPICPGACALQQGSHCNSKPAHHNEAQTLLSTAREDPHTAVKIQCIQQ